MTNHWVDLKNTDCVVVMGGNAAENHPMSFKWITKAMEERGAKLIVVDPRFTRSAAKADIYAPIRSGSDITFIMGMINYIIQNKKYHEDYVKHYTNSTLLINPGFKMPGDLNGLFSGYDSTARKYDTSTWGYQLEDIPDEKAPGGVIHSPKRDMTMSDPNCVWQLLKKHASRYTPEMVEKVCGTPKDKFLEICEEYSKTGASEKAGTICYAMGWTQHTVGVENIRSFAMVQLLLGNMGRPGGGVNALRGEPNVQGSTDHCLLFHILPGYLSVVKAGQTFRSYADAYTIGKATKNVLPGSTSWWRHGEKYLVSLLKEWWGDAATADNDFRFDWLPKIGGGFQGGGYSHIALFEAMYAGEIKGMLVLGQNPAIGGPNSNIEAAAMDNLEWLVDLNLWETETNSFWKRPGCNSGDIQTEVWRLPAADSCEKDGSISNSGRWIQWRWKGCEPLGDCKTDLEVVDLVVKELKKLYAAEGGAGADIVTKLNWDYSGPNGDPDVEEVAKACHGYEWPSRNKLVDKNFVALQKDGSTACGNWLFSGTFTPDGENLMKRRIPEAEGIGNNLEWSFAWPVNRRIVYNRASADLNGKPWNPEIPEIWWDEAQGKWVGNDIPDFGGTKAPSAAGGNLPAIMINEGVFRLFAPRAEGPFPEHYEPIESPVDNIMSGQQNNPAVVLWHEINPDTKIGTADEYPIIGSTYRVTEHWQTGIMTRNQPWLVDLMPEMFVEISKELADEKGIDPGETVEVFNARGSLQAVAIVTGRVKPQNINGKTVHFAGLPWCYGYAGLCTGGSCPTINYSANQLTPHVGDANTMIPEYKTFLVDIRKVK